MNYSNILAMGLIFIFHFFKVNAAEVQMSLEVFPVLESIGIGSDGSVVYDSQKWKQNKFASTSNVTSYDFFSKGANTMKRLVIEKDKNNNAVTKSVSYLGFYEKNKKNEIQSSIYIGLEKNEFYSVTTCKEEFIENSQLPKCYTVTKDLCDNVLKASDSKNWDEVKGKLQSCSNLISLARSEKIPKPILTGIKQAEEKAIEQLTFFQTQAAGLDVAIDLAKKAAKAVFLSSFDPVKPGQTINSLYGLDEKYNVIGKNFGITNIVNLCASGVLNTKNIKLSNKTLDEVSKQSK